MGLGDVTRNINILVSQCKLGQKPFCFLIDSVWVFVPAKLHILSPDDNITYLYHKLSPSLAAAAILTV